MYSQLQMIPIDLFCNEITICELPLSAHRQATQYASSCPEKYHEESLKDVYNIIWMGMFLRSADLVCNELLIIIALQC